ncbi:glucose-1-phosphate adenylyltransferase [Paenibacillus sp. GCM10023252]|uniref:glucose-1-phosphate adenylyltransferase n=1 Tax=Paenibacillus sp. GCM10023252 TaxID=3252649 RepID=UPI00361FB642
MSTTNCIALILAGGEGKRLAPLTQKMAKPAVPFGGNYRIIDFPLSNCINSGLSTIGVVTQYKAESLHDHIGSGEAWSVRQNCTIDLLPHTRVGTSEYAGTADAVYRNMDYLDRVNPEHVLVLSGDHIYHMDYREMLEQHASSSADMTIAVKQVPWKDAHRFGILSADKDSRVTAFQEKPAKPESNLASLGIYIFKWEVLRELLHIDAQNSESSRDFGKDIIPQMLEAKANMYSYTFDGYWRDVGTVDSLWESHMDLLNGEFELEGSAWPMYTSEPVAVNDRYPYRFADVQQSLTHGRCSVEGDLDRSVVFRGARIGRGSNITESIIMPNVQVGRHAQIHRAIIGEGTIIEDGAIVGDPHGEIVVIGANELVLADERFLPNAAHVVSGLYAKTAAIADDVSLVNTPA